MPKKIVSIREESKDDKLTYCVSIINSDTGESSIFELTTKQYEELCIKYDL